MAQDQDLCGLPRLLTPRQPQPGGPRVIRRKTNRRHMTGDHHGRTSEKATLQVRATDEILGTHTCRAPVRDYRADHHGRRDQQQRVDRDPCRSLMAAAPAQRRARTADLAFGMVRPRIIV